ncbi:YhdP family protein [Dongia rigui]|uniref:AsmA-like C-terminal domain-containing protein n=1 Tax=Dongia rigui TaxID=940149 RepID=A0ABU5DVU9_9PROT|nr:AsmA-like C-terminal domain-containing protein [Dongia rigui]MDY0870721.1 AsmA-like C-terminal domain-containing protein [Dongia rigui]
MIRRTTIITLEILGAALAGAAIILAFLTWRLTQEGPIHLRFLSSYVEQALIRSDQPYRLAVDDTVLTWAGWDRALDVRAINLRVRDQDGRELANLPEVSITFSARALFKGLVAPSKIEIIGPKLTLIRNKDGSLAFGPGGVTSEPTTKNSDGSFEALMLLAGDMLETPDRSKPTGYLTSAAILNGSVQIVDNVTGLTWQADNFGAEARREPGGLAGDLFAALPQFGDPAIVSAKLDYRRDTRKLGIDATVASLQLSSLGLIEPALSDLSTTDLAITAAVQTSIEIANAQLGDLGEVNFTLSSGSGALDLPSLTKQPVPVTSLNVAGRLDRDGDVMSISSLDLDIGGPRITAKADWQGAFSGKAADGGAPVLTADLKVVDLPAELLDPYWPEMAAADTRNWVVPNIPHGMVDEASAHMSLRLPVDGSGAKVEDMMGTLKTSDLTVHYLRPMPPITKGVATAEFDAKTFTAKITGGEVGNIKIKQGDLVVTGLNVEDQFIKVGGDVAAPLQDALALLDHPRLGYAKKLGINPKTSSGDATANIFFDFPAAKKLTFAEVKVKVAAEMHNVQVAKLRFDKDVTQGDLKLTLDEKGMNLQGPMVFADVPMTFDWSQTFEDDAAYDERLHVIGNATAAQVAAIGFDYRPWVDGACQCDVTYTTLPGGRSTLNGAFDLTNAVLDVPAAKWRKEAGVPGRADLTLEMVNEKPVAIPQFTVTAGDLATGGALQFAADGTISRVTLPEIKLGGSHLLGFDAELKEGWSLITVTGGTLDASPWMDDKTQPTEAELARTGPERQRPFTIKGQLAELRLGEGRELTNATIEAIHDPFWWDVVAFQATLPSGQPITFDYRPSKAGQHALKINTKDGGGALRVLDLYNSVKGGTLSITGTVKDDQPWRPLKGKISMSSFRVINTPFVARFLTVATITGVVDAVTGEGFLFGGAEGRFTKTRGLIEVSKFRSAGPSLGLTAAGKIDLDRNNVNVKGTLVPAYAINSVLGNIPLIGAIIQGGEGEGLFAATYAVTGNLNEPKIDVNEWSALAPGFIRDLFTDDGTEGQEPDPDETPTTKKPAKPQKPDQPHPSD